MSIKTVVFDMDGVLIDSEVIWGRVRATYAAEIGRTWTQRDQEALMGFSASQWSERMRDMLQLTDISARELEHELRRRVYAAFEQDLPVRPGAGEALEALGRHWPMALASGSPRDLVELAMARTGFAKHFEFFITGDDVARGKPDPEIYLRTLGRLGVAAQEAVGVEDSANGILALRAAGMWAIAAPCPEFPLSLGMRALAHAEVDDLAMITPQYVCDIPKAKASRITPDR